jgi:hypothetical protein
MQPSGDQRYHRRNRLRVLGTAERRPLDQGGCQPVHAKRPWLDMVKPPEEPRACLLPGACPIHASPQGLAGGRAAPVTPSLGAVAVAGRLGNVGEHARMEHTRASGRGINARVESPRGASKVQPHRFGPLLHGREPLEQQDPVRLMDWSQGKGGQSSARMVGDGDARLALRRLVARRPEAIAPGGATGWVPSPWRRRPSSVCSSERCPTLAMHACWNDPSSTPGAKARSAVVS